MKKEQFLSAGVHIGMKNRTKFMYEHVYKIRPDGLTVLNLQTIMDRIQTIGKFLSQYKPEKIILVAGREQARKPAEKFAELTGVTLIAGRFYPGTLTNFKRDAEVVFITDMIADKQAVTEAYQMGLPIIALCNVNDEPAKIDLMIPCNNKGRKSLAAIFWALANSFLKAKGDLAKNKEISASTEDFMK